jgi:antitoxin VapB
MSIQIANPVVVKKIERLAAKRGLTKTAAVEQAVDAALAAEPDNAAGDDFEVRIRALLAQMDQIPERPDAFDPLEWDEFGLPN